MLHPTYFDSSHRPLFWLISVLLCMVIAPSASLATPGFPVRYNGTRTILVNGGVSNPQGVTADLSGNLYVADTGGNRIIKVAPDGTTATFAISIGGAPVTLSGPRQMAMDTAGNLYVTDTGNNRVLKTDAAGTGTLLSIGSGLSPASLSGPQAVAVDSQGNVFICDTGNNRIVEIPAAGSPSVVSTSALSSPQGIATDVFGNLYVVDSGHNRVIKKPTSGAESTLSTSGSLSSPVAVAVGMNGVVHIVDGTNRIAVVTPQGDAYDLFFGEVNSDFGVPSAVAVSPLGTVYLTDSSNSRVNAFQVDTAGFPSVTLGSSGTPQTLRFDVSSTSTLTAVAIYTSGTQNLDFTIASNGGTPCASSSHSTTCTVNVQFTPTSAGLRRGALVLSYTDTSFGTGSITVPLYGSGNAPVAALSPGAASVVNAGSVSIAQPFQTARDGVGNIYVTSYQNSTLLKIPAGGGSGTTVTIPSLPTPHTLNSPTGLAIDGAGNLFIADYNNSRIVEVTAAGASKVIAIRGLPSNLSFPTTLNFTANGRLLVDDYGNGRVIMLSPDIYNNGSNNGDGTAGFSAGYVLPLGSYTLGADNSTGVVADAAGDIYFTDQNANPGRVIKLDPYGKLAPVSLPAVTLNAPLGVAVDPSQNLFVVDSGNQRIIQQTRSGATSVVQYSGPSLGQFVFGLEPDGGGNLLICDFINNRLILDNVSQSSLTFPSTLQFARSTTKTATLTNLGNQPLVLSANPTYTANFSFDITDPNPCTSSTSLSPGTNCDVPLIFSPQTAGNLSANIVVTDDALNVGGTTQQIAVSGTAASAGDTTSTTKTNPASTSYAYGQPLTVSVQVQDLVHTSSVPTGSVTFTDSLTSTSAQKTLDSSGNAILLDNNVLSGIGTHSIVASYAGVTGSFLSSSTTVSVTINKDTVVVSGPGPLTVQPGQSGSAAISVAPATINGSFASGASLPSGAITYSISNGSSTVVAATTASLTAGTGNSAASVPIPDTLAAGTYSIDISYPGDSNYESGSTTVAFTVATSSTSTPGFTISGSPSTITVQQGKSGTSTVTFTPTGGFTGTVSLSCTGLPEWASCNFNRQSFVADGSDQPQTGVLTFSTQTLASLDNLRHSLAITLCLGLFMPGWALARERPWQARQLASTQRHGLMILAALAALFVLSGCDSRVYNPAQSGLTPVGSYTVTVTASASGGQAGSQQSAHITFVVVP